MDKYNSQLGTNDRSTGLVLYIPGAGRSAAVRLEWQARSMKFWQFKMENTFYSDPA
jgi:hypothetical protein